MPEQENKDTVTVDKTTTIDKVVDEIQAKSAETQAAKDYSKYAGDTTIPVQVERRQFDFISVSGAVETEVIVVEGQEVEKRKPAVATKLFLTKPRTTDNRFESEVLTLPLTIVPIKYRMVMEQRTGSKGEVLVLKSTEFNARTSDKVVISRFTPDGKVVEKYGPMTVSEARAHFQDGEGKGVLRDKAHVYALHNGEIIRFVVKGAGLWENRKDLINGKTEASRKEYPYLSEYLSTFPINQPYFLHEMKIDAAYRDHGTVKFYRPTFERGDRINEETETKVIEALDDLIKYFAEQDKATAEFVPDKPGVIGQEGDEEAQIHADKPF